MYLSISILRNLKVCEYMKHMLELHRMREKLQLIHISLIMYCHA